LSRGAKRSGLAKGREIAVAVASFFSQRGGEKRRATGLEEGNLEEGGDLLQPGGKVRKEGVTGWLKEIASRPVPSIRKSITCSWLFARKAGLQRGSCGKEATYEIFWVSRKIFTKRWSRLDSVE